MTAAPLAGLRVVELGGIGPAPFCGMVLAGLGAEVIQVARADAMVFPVLDRNRTSLAVDLKNPRAVEIVRELVDTADVLLEGFRPGVAERLGFDPGALRRTNPRLVVGRMTGYGQAGPDSQRAGHDINYLAATGALHAMGDADRPPTPPLNLVADFGGGGMLLAVGVLAAVLEARISGRGQDIDAAMVDGASLLQAMEFGFAELGRWNPAARGENLFDGSWPFYACYRTSDDEFMAVGAIEPQFYAALVDELGLTGQLDPARQRDPATFAEQRTLFARSFAGATRAEWTARFAARDACVSPVLSMAEAAADPHLVERGTLVRDSAGVVQPAPAPRFSRSATVVPEPASPRGADTARVLRELGLAEAEIAELAATGAVTLAGEASAGDGRRQVAADR